MKIGKIISAYSVRLPKAHNPMYICDTCDTTFNRELSYPYGRMGGEVGKDCPMCLVKSKKPSKKLTQEQVEEKKTQIKEKLNK